MNTFENQIINPDKIDEMSENKKKYLQIIKKAGINIDKIPKYLEIMKNNDIQILNALSGFEDISDEEIADSFIQNWEDVVKKYNNIDIRQLDTNTGLDIVTETKSLINKMYIQLRIFLKKQKKLKNGQSLDIPDEIINLKKQIELKAREYGLLPLYMTYHELADTKRFNSEYINNVANELIKLDKEMEKAA